MNGTTVRPGRRAILLACVWTVCSTACVFHGPNAVRRDLQQDSGVKLESELGLTFGPTSLWIARSAGAFDAEDVADLRGVRKVQVGVYRVVGKPKAPRLEPLERRGFLPLVRVREGGEEAAVLARRDAGQLRELLIVVAADDEWVVVRMRGRLDALIDDALEMAFDEADNPELHAAVRRELPREL